VMVTDDGREMSFRGVFLEIEPPTRMVQTWRFEGWPDAEAVETVDFHETDGVTTMTWKLAFRDQAGRDHMTQYDGIEAGWDNVEAYLRTQLAAGSTGPVEPGAADVSGPSPARRRGSRTLPRVRVARPGTARTEARSRPHHRAPPR
jgi:hypothetical protein